ncbi:MAG: hypothetical protein JNL58_07520 [Planctomyces sp.]|nr:hypothetical protein [Planctomyces sp.]
MATRLPDNSLPVSRGISKDAPGVLLRRLVRAIQEVYRGCGVHSRALKQERRSRIRKSGSKDLTTHVSGSVETPESRIVLSVNAIAFESGPESLEVETQVEFVAETTGEADCGITGEVDGGITGEAAGNDVPEQPEVIDDLEQTKVIVKRRPPTASSQDGQSGGDLSGVGLSGDDFTSGIGGIDGLPISQPYPNESGSSSFEQQADSGSTNGEVVDDEEVSNELTDDLFSSGAALDSVLSSAIQPEQINSRAGTSWVALPSDGPHAESPGTRSAEFRTDLNLNLTADSAAGVQFRERGTWDSIERTASQIPVDRLTFELNFGDSISDQPGVTKNSLHQLAAELMLTMSQTIQLLPTMGSDVTLTDVLFDVESEVAIRSDSAISDLFASWIDKLGELPAAGNLWSSTSSNTRAGANATGVDSRLTTESESGTEVNRIRLIVVSRQKSWNIESSRTALPGEPSAEASEFGALGQLTFHMDPRGPPESQRSDPLKQTIESNADAEQLRRLRYSIAPRGPSLVA